VKTDWFWQPASLYTVALLGMDGAMDDIPVFSPAAAQALLAYKCSKKLLLHFLILDKDFAKISN
jgi:hypothetical protein